MFWGLTIEPGKHYTQTVEESFHVSMVALDTRDVAATEREQAKMTQLMVHHDKAEFLVCTLCYGNVLQQALDLNFTEGEEVTFFSEGRGTLHLTGYLVKDEPLGFDPDGLTGDMLTGLEELRNYSDGWASGEESSTEGHAGRGRRSRRLPLRPQRRPPVLTAPPRRLAFASSRGRQETDRGGGGGDLGRWSRRRRRRRKWPDVRPSRYVLVSDKEDYYVPVVRSDAVRRPRPEQRVVLCTADNVRATLTLSENTRLVSSGSREDEDPLGSAVHDRPKRLSLLAEVLRAPRQQTDRAAPLASQDGLHGDADDAVGSEDDRPFARPLRTKPAAERAASRENHARADNAAAARRPTAKPSTSRRKPLFVRRAQRQAPATPPSSRLLSPDPNGPSTEGTRPETLPGNGSPAKVNPRKRQLKSLLPGLQQRQQKRPLGGGYVLPHKRMFQRKAPPQDQGGMAETPPSLEGTAADQEAVEMMVSQFDSEGLGQAFIDDQSQQLSNCYSHPDGNTDQMLSQEGMPQTHHATPDLEPRPAPEPMDQYMVDSKHNVVPTSLALAMDPAHSRLSPPVSNMAPPVTGVVPTGGAFVRNSSTVYWSCLTDEQAEMLGEGESRALNANSNAPVAMDMDFLTAEDMSCNGANIGNQKVRLAHGYDIFVSRFDLWQAEKASFKKGWTILTRRLLDIFFDRMTLAMGKPTHHGNSMEYIPLDQNVVGAIMAFIKSRYNIMEKRKLIQAISIYCSDCRKSGVPGHMM